MPSSPGFLPYLHIVTGANAVLDSGASYGVGINGRHLVAVAGGFTATGAAFSGTNVLNGTFGAPGITVLAVLNGWSATQGSSLGNLAGGTAGSGIDGFGIDLTGHPMLYHATQTSSTRTLTTNAPYVLAVTFIESVGTNFWINGVNETLIADAGFSMLTAITRVGGIAGQGSIGANIALVAAWNRAFSDVEMRSLCHLSLHHKSIVQPVKHKLALRTGFEPVLTPL